MRPPLQVRVCGRQLARLCKMYRETRCPRTQLRVQMVLLSHAGYSIEEISQITHKSDETVRRWLQRFEQAGCGGLVEAPHCGRPPQISPAIEQFLLECVLKSPRDFGVNRPTWTTGSLAKLLEYRFQVQVTNECVRQHLHLLGIVCRRPTWTVKHLAQQQPGYAQKKGLFLGS